MNIHGWKCSSVILANVYLLDGSYYVHGSTLPQLAVEDKLIAVIREHKHLAKHITTLQQLVKHVQQFHDSADTIESDDASVSVLPFDDVADILDLDSATVLKTLQGSERAMRFRVKPEQLQDLQDNARNVTWMVMRVDENHVMWDFRIDGYQHYLHTGDIAITMFDDEHRVLGNERCIRRGGL